MRFKVINLTRTPDRLYTFKKNNPNLMFDRFSAIDGQTIDRDSLVRDGLATEACARRYTPGAIGVALSHRQLWLECAEAGVPYTVLEDDVHLAANFNNSVYTYTASNPNWDFIFWGANFDQKLIVELSPGIAAAEVNYNFSGITNNIGLISNQILKPSVYRTWWTVGLCCYTITPNTAKYLLSAIFPLRDYFDWRDNYGIDNSVIEELANMNAGVCLPPMALTLNDRYNSTVQINNYGLEIKVKNDNNPN
jgi:GR25 family glycosyltransferase involved in LPS biosynthesis